ncbi:MAG TPA: DUF1579 domain-containing protein [Lacipirellulaceae bacterium]|nr:DUF1579 domain-containing protein [Lacipirellulaceae bacterium]
MSHAQPTPGHAWLHRLVGRWTSTFECRMAPDEPLMHSTGSETVRSLGGLWTLGEGLGDAPDGQPTQSLMTLGYDPATKRFVGTFVVSVMAHLWVYDGALDAAGQRLILDTEGPSFSGAPGMVKYQDIIEFLDDNHRTLTGLDHGPDGNYRKFMTDNYRRET